MLLLPNDRRAPHAAANDLLTLIRETQIADRKLRDEALSHAKGAWLRCVVAASHDTRAGKAVSYVEARSDVAACLAVLETAVATGSAPPELLGKATDLAAPLVVLLTKLGAAL